jgi:dihydroflavonol-4-reductase
MIVVCGASGHVGANLVRMMLERGETPRVVVHREAASLDGLQVERVEGDLLAPESLAAAFRGADAVIQLAALISITGDQGGRVRAMNVQGARNAARAAREAGVRRFIHVSSVHAYAHSPDVPVVEGGPRPGAKAPAYDRSKAEGEEAVLEEARGDLPGGGWAMEAVVVNPSGVIGPFDFGPSRFGQSLVQMARGRLPALVDGGFDWVDARDVCASILAALERGRAGEGYLLGGRWASVVEIARMVAEQTGVPAARLATPRWLASAVAPLAQWGQATIGQEPLFTPEGLHALFHGSRKVDWSKAARELGHSPRPLPETIRDTVGWFREAGRLG